MKGPTPSWEGARRAALDSAERVLGVSATLGLYYIVSPCVVACSVRHLLRISARGEKGAHFDAKERRLLKSGLAQVCSSRRSITLLHRLH